MTPAKRTSYLSPAACAFIASGIEILSFGFSFFQRMRVVQAADANFFLPPVSFYIALAVGVLGLAAQARALSHVGRIQQALAPFSARAGRIAVATYVVVGLLVFVLMATRLSGTALFQVDTLAFWLVQMPRFALTIAFAFLGWASRGDADPWQRWASTGLLVLGTLGTLSIVWWLFRLPTGPRFLWLAGVHVALRAATWAAIGAWLKGRKD